MGHLSTHVLDTMNGCPAAGMRVELQRLDGAEIVTLKNFALNAGGRKDGGALLAAQTTAVGSCRLVFSVAPYFRALGVKLPEPAFLDEVLLDFGIADAGGRDHVQPLASPWVHSTYRGS